jgi:tellurite methyltransferase
VTDWDERYRKGEHAFTHPHRLLVKAVEQISPGRALDIACGAGRHSIYLAGQGWDVTAVDSSKVGIRLTQQRAAEAGVNVATQRADLERGEYVIESESYDLICDFYYLQRDLFESIKNGVRRGGMFVASIHIVDDEPDAHPMNPAFLLEPNELKQLFAGWQIDHYHEGRWDDPEHKHRDAEIIARKI